MCDYLNEAYPSFYQQAWHSGTLWKMSEEAAQMHPDGSSGPASAPAMQLYPPVISAGIWHAVVRLLCASIRQLHVMQWCLVFGALSSDFGTMGVGRCIL